MGLVMDIFSQISLSTANLLYTWGWRLSLFGAAITLIGVTSLMIGTKVRDHDFESQMAYLNKSAAEANERTATLIKEAEEAKLAQEKLKASVQWRAIPIEVRNQLIVSLSKTPYNISINYVANDPEAIYFAKQFIDIFKESNWGVIIHQNTYSEAVLDLHIQPSDNEASKLINFIFSENGFKFSADMINRPHSMYSKDISPLIPKHDTATIIIGSKTPPFE